MLSNRLKLTHLLLALVMVGAGVLGPHTGSHAFATDDESNTMEVFRASSPAVVYVTNQTLVRDRYSFNLHTVPQGSGTGVIWNKDGYILTNFHVIDGARQITITLQDQTSWPAEIIGTSPAKDLAVLRIKAPREKLTPLPLGNSSSLTVGRKVLAIGNPFGLDTTLTVGVVSALGREIQSTNQRTIRNLIQTDAAINPGNSGGPLINSNGELIGINTAIYSPSGASVGIGFAIPVNSVKKIVPALIQHGRILRPTLGVEIAPTHWAARAGVTGVPILRVTANSPAAKAGLQGVRRSQQGSAVLGDIIIRLGNQSIANYDDLLNALEKRDIGDKVAIEVVRRGKMHKLHLTLAAPH